MKVGAAETSAWFAGRAERLEQNRAMQDVFSKVLIESGREGYASAEAVGEGVPMTEQIAASWSSWFDGEHCGRGYQTPNEFEEVKQTYGDILVRAYEERGYADPKAFLKTLSHEEMSVVQRINGLADPIQVDSLTEERALNLLLPAAAQVDLNRDGLTHSGLGYTKRFPDSNTPGPVVQAWEEATGDLDFEELMIREFQMTLPLLSANVVCDENGKFLYSYQPGDAEFRNPMASENYSYVQAAQDRLDSLETHRLRISTEKYEKDKAFWTNFQDLLVEYEAK